MSRPSDIHESCTAGLRIRSSGAAITVGLYADEKVGEGVMRGDECSCGWVTYICGMDFHIIIVWKGNFWVGIVMGVMVAS